MSRELSGCGTGRTAAGLGRSICLGEFAGCAAGAGCNRLRRSAATGLSRSGKRVSATCRDCRVAGDRHLRGTAAGRAGRNRHGSGLRRCGRGTRITGGTRTTELNRLRAASGRRFAPARCSVATRLAGRRDRLSGGDVEAIGSLGGLNLRDRRPRGTPLRRGTGGGFRVAGLPRSSGVRHLNCLRLINRFGGLRAGHRAGNLRRVTRRGIPAGRIALARFAARGCRGERGRSRGGSLRAEVPL